MIGVFAGGHRIASCRHVGCLGGKHCAPRGIGCFQQPQRPTTPCVSQPRARRQIDSKSTASRLQIDCKSTASRLQIDCKSAASRQQIDCKSTASRRRIDGRSTASRLQVVAVSSIASSSSCWKADDIRLVGNERDLQAPRSWWRSFLVRCW